MSIIRRPRVESSSCVYMTVCQRHAWKGDCGGTTRCEDRPITDILPNPLCQAALTSRFCNKTVYLCFQRCDALGVPLPFVAVCDSVDLPFPFPLGFGQGAP